MNARSSVIILMLFLLNASFAIADPGPNEAQSIKQLLKDWNKHAGDWTIEETLKTYSATTDDSRHLARVLAEQVAAESKLQNAVRRKWGEEAEQKVATACGSDTAKDDEEAEVIINANHAIVKIKNIPASPLMLVKVAGEWKVDCDAYLTAAGDHLADYEKALHEITVAVADDAKQLGSGRFKSVDDLVVSLKGRFEEIDEGK